MSYHINHMLLTHDIARHLLLVFQRSAERGIKYANWGTDATTLLVMVF